MSCQAKKINIFSKLISHLSILHIITLAVLANLASPCFAVLPPFYQGAKEITAILNNEDVGNKITSGRVIKKVERTDAGYRITANECTLDIGVNYVASKGGRVGPAEFELVVGNLTCDNPEDQD